MRTARPNPVTEASASDAGSDAAFEALLEEAARLTDPLPAPSVAALPLGSTLAGGRFQILRLLGQGGMGRVYEAFDSERGARVALKLLSHLTAEGVYRLKNEFRALGRITHPNLVQLYELFAEEGRWFYTMELVRGEPFDRHVRPHGALALARLRPALVQLADGVRAIHAAGKLHRDLKPSNVLVDARARVVVLDFGLVVDAMHGGIGQTRSEHAICGTPAYMAPEQAAGTTVSEASDLYAIGVMLFEALTGQRPFAGTPGEVAAAKQHERPVAPHRIHSGAPRDLDAVCCALLARDPAARPTAGALLRMLGADVGEDAATAERVTLFGRDGEQQALRRASDDALAGQSVVVCVTGESGIGKSALCQAALTEAAARCGATFLAGRCHERESVPFKAFDGLIDATCRTLRRLPEPEVAALVPREAAALVRVFSAFTRVAAFAQHTLAAAPPSALQERAFAAYSELLTRLAARGPLILWLDDLHWADADSLTLLEHLLTHLSAPLLLVLSRRGSSDDDALTRTLARAADRRRVRVELLTLAPLSAHATAQLVASLAPDADCREAIVRGSVGNPLLATQLARFAARRAPLQLPSFEALLDAQLTALPPGAVRLLQLLAFASAPLLARVALAAADAEHRDFEQLAALRLARVEASHGTHGSGKTLACYHDRIREVLAATLCPATRQRCAARLAAVLRDLDADGLALLIRCHVATGRVDEAARLTRIAADRAMAALAFDRAAALYAQLLAAPNLAPKDACALHERHGQALEAAGRADDAASAYRRAAMLTRGSAQLALLQRAAGQLLFGGWYAEGMPLLAEVCRAHDVPLPGSKLGEAARLIALRGRLRARGLGFTKTSVLSVSQQTRLELHSLSALAVLNYRPPLHGMCAITRFLLVALDSGSVPHALQALGLNAIALAHRDANAPYCHALVARLADIARDDPNPIAGAYASFVRGAVAHLGGRFVEARGEIAEALAGYRVPGGSLHVAVDIALLYEQLNDHALADYAKLAAETPAAISEAYRRGRVWLGAMLMGLGGLVAFLLTDDVSAAAGRLADARSRQRPSLQLQRPDVALHVFETALLVYTGEPARAVALQQTRVQADGARGSLVREQMLLWGGRLAAAALGHERPRGARRDELRAMITSAIGAARRETQQGPLAHLFRAVLAHDAGDDGGAVASLQQLLEETSVPARHLVTIAARRRLGELVGGSHGAALVDEARHAMRDHGVRNPDAMAELFVPGLRVR